VKNRFQNLPFKCNLQRYTAVWRTSTGKLRALFSGGGGGGDLGGIAMSESDDDGRSWWGAAR
jgi:hypothetical protein